MNEIQHPSLRRLLVGFDFSLRARNAAETAFELAARVGGTVQLAASLPGRVDSQVLIDLARRDPATFGQTDMADNGAILLESGLQALRAICAAMEPASVPWTVSTSLDGPVDMIHDIVEEENIDLVLVGSTGAGNVRRWLVGSTAEKLAKDIPRPLWVASDHRPMRRILCPLDPTRVSARAMVWAWSLSKRFGAELHVLHAWEPGSSESMEAAHQAFDAFLDASGVRGDIADIHFHVASAADFICEQTATLNADLIVIGNKRRQGVSAVVMGSTATRVLQKMPASVLMV